jgi:hypothetical protein
VARGFFSRLLDLFPQPELTQAVLQAEAGLALGDDLEPNLIDKVLPVLNRRGAVDHVAKRLRSDRTIMFNADGPMLARGRAARLNHVMAFAVLQASAKAGVQIRRSTGKIAGVVKDSSGFHVTGPVSAGGPPSDPFGMVILRHGPNRAERYGVVSPYYGDYRAYAAILLTSAPELAEPPRLHPSTFAFFDPLFSNRFLDLQSNQARIALTRTRDTTLLISWDSAAHMPIQQGVQDLKALAFQCERLTKPVTLQLNAARAQLSTYGDVLFRLAKASAGNIKLESGADFGSEWNDFDSTIAAGSTFTSPYPILELPDATSLWEALEQCLLRHIDAGLETVINTTACDAIGPIHADIVATLKPTWSGWRTVIDASPKMRSDFLKLLVRVEQAGPERWDGNHGCLPNLVAALVLMLATHAGESFLPAQCTPGNLMFGGTAVGLGSGCDRVLGRPIADMQDPEAWNVDALILSAATEEMFADAGLISDAGATPPTLLRPARVAPVVVQNTRIWRERLNAGPSHWTPAVLKEFASWRARQDAQLKDISC